MHNKWLFRLALGIYLILQTLCFQSNVLRVAKAGRFDGFANNTNAMIHARLALSEQEGLFSGGGLLLRDMSKPREEQADHNYYLYVMDLPISDRVVYYKSRPVYKPPCSACGI